VGRNRCWISPGSMDESHACFMRAVADIYC
jgi:hypothetical protein